MIAHNTISTDPIADMLARIRNAIAVRKREITIPHSKMKAAIAELLKSHGFIAAFRVSGEGTTKILELALYDAEENPRITKIDRMSKPGRRYYVNSQEIPVVKRGRGIVIVSTSKGLLTGDEAKKQHIGGELICKVY